MKRVYYMFGLLALFGVVFAAAATLTVDGGVLQAGSDIVLTCDDDGVFVDGWGYENDDLSVSYVRINGISTACSGLEMHVDVYNSSNVLIGDGGMWIVDNSGIHTFSFGGPIPAADVDHINIGITT